MIHLAAVEEVHLLVEVVEAVVMILLTVEVVEVAHLLAEVGAEGYLAVEETKIRIDMSYQSSCNPLGYILWQDQLSTPRGEEDYTLVELYFLVAGYM